MVAPKPNIADRFMPPPEPFLAGRWLLPKFTRRDAAALVKLRIIPEDASTELLNGAIVVKDRAGTGEDPLTIGKDHRKTVKCRSDLRSRLNNDRQHLLERVGDARDQMAGGPTPRGIWLGELMGGWIERAIAEEDRHRIASSPVQTPHVMRAKDAAQSRGRQAG